MAFSLPNYTDPTTGESITYFVMNAVHLDLLNSQLTIFVSGYVNQAAHGGGLAPSPEAANISFVVSGALYAQFLGVTTVADLPAGSLQSDLITELLGALSINMLTLPFFTGATIVS